MAEPASAVGRTFASPAAVMEWALTLAARGLGAVEPNPPVGAVVVNDQLQCLGDGCHTHFGGPHAEVMALKSAGDLAAGATLFVTLEPCCHWGKTPPCVDAVIAAGIRRVFVAAGDRAPHVAGKGMALLQAAGIDVQLGPLQSQSQALLAPFFRLMLQQRPWIHAKWAMTLDGKLASRTGHSQWISNAESRARVHQLRGRVDAIAVGLGTVLADDPQLTARPPGPRIATRVVFDSDGRIPLTSQLVQTAHAVPTMLCTTDQAPDAATTALRERQVEVVTLSTDVHGHPSLPEFLDLCGQRSWTHVLVEGGSELLGSFWDQQLIDEWHVFIAPKVLGGGKALSPLQGVGLAQVPEIPTLHGLNVERLGDDIYLSGRSQ
jgi:diaminohydroxyphosphoribosylaminopyrimidine deaminase / 5-amino-6-(5-phosphoribosylamino)uracil reductase